MFSQRQEQYRSHISCVFDSKLKVVDIILKYIGGDLYPYAGPPESLPELSLVIPRESDDATLSETMWSWCGIHIVSTKSKNAIHNRDRAEVGL